MSAGSGRGDGGERGEQDLGNQGGEARAEGREGGDVA